MTEKFYITTPLYYVNDLPHIGHLFEALGIDAQARFQRLLGKQVMFLTGTDEHGSKIENEAKRRQLAPQQLVDEMAARFQELWKEAGISYDYFIRTTSSRHQEAVQKFFMKVYENGDIYKGCYEGCYCLPCETFWSEASLCPGRTCPECGRATSWSCEDAYFFRLSKYQDWLLGYLEEHPKFIQPKFRELEIINSFLKPGLVDLCISRTSVKWGIPLPLEEGHIIYVWFDALINYVSAIGYADDETTFQCWWPAQVHVVGKDILKFHTTIWPAMLRSAGLEPPESVFGHGFVVMREEKMSKSKGNIISPQEPMSRYGTDALRYYMLREIDYSQDGTYSDEGLRTRYNGDLANNLGNLLSRVGAMVEKYRQGELPKPPRYGAAEQQIIEGFTTAMEKWQRLTPEFKYNQVLTELWETLNLVNKYINEMEPWQLAKEPSKAEQLDSCLYCLAEALRLFALLIYPFMPGTAQKIWEQLGIDKEIEKIDFEEQRRWGLLPERHRLGRRVPLFPRL